MIKEYNYFSKIYKVEGNETMNEISLKFNIEPSILYEFNDIKEIEKGDLIFIPKKNLAIHIVSPCETLESIAKKYDVSIDYIKSKNNITNLFVGLKLYI